MRYLEKLKRRYKFAVLLIILGIISCGSEKQYIIKNFPNPPEKPKDYLTSTASMICKYWGSEITEQEILNNVDTPPTYVGLKKFLKSKGFDALVIYSTISDLKQFIENNIPLMVEHFNDYSYQPVIQIMLGYNDKKQILVVCDSVYGGKKYGYNEFKKKWKNNRVYLILPKKKIHLIKGKKFKYQDALEAYELGTKYKFERNYKKAIDEFKKSVELYPEYGEAWNDMGVIYTDYTNEQDKAIECFNKAISIKDYNTKEFAYLNLGTAYQNKGMYDKAIEVLMKAMEINPEFPKSYNDLGVILFLKEEYDEALKNFLKAIELNKDYAKAYYNVACIYGRRKEYNKAIENLKQCIKSNPQMLSAQHYLAICLIQINKIEEAKFQLEEILKMDPENKKALQLLKKLSK
jgi:tetratricopeptide (TPR) repeat protein